MDATTFGVLDAVTLTRANIVSASTSAGALPEDGTAAWSAGETCAAGDLRHRVSTGVVYVRVTPGAVLELRPVQGHALGRR